MSKIEFDNPPPYGTGELKVTIIFNHKHNFIENVYVDKLTALRIAGSNTKELLAVTTNVIGMKKDSFIKKHLNRIKTIQALTGSKRLFVECFPTDEAALKFPNTNLAVKEIFVESFPEPTNTEGLIYCNYCKCNTKQVDETSGTRCQKCGNQNPFGDCGIVEFGAYMLDMIRLHNWRDMEDVYNYFNKKKSEIKKFITKSKL